MKHLLVKITTYAGDHYQEDSHIAICKDGQKPSHIGDAIAKGIFNSPWDEWCGGFNTDDYLWHRRLREEEITEEQFKTMEGLIQTWQFSDEELAEVQKEMEEGE